MATKKRKNIPVNFQDVSDVFGNISFKGQSWLRFLLVMAAVCAIIGVFIASVISNIHGNQLVSFAILCALLFLLATATVFILVASSSSGANKKQLCYLAAHIAIWVVTVFGGLCILSLQKHPDLTTIILVAAAITSLAFIWGYEEKWAKPIIYTVAIMLLTVSILISAYDTYGDKIPTIKSEFTVKNVTVPAITVPIETPAPAPAPAPIAQITAEAPTAETPVPKINISGDWSFDWGDPGSTGFRISHVGTSLSGKSNYNPGEMILKGFANGTSGEGTWELIGHPAGHLQGRFYITSLTDSAGEGTWVHNDGHTTRMIMKRI